MNALLEEVPMPNSALEYVETVLQGGNALSTALRAAQRLDTGSVQGVLFAGATLPNDVNYQLSLSSLQSEATGGVPSLAAVRDYLASEVGRTLSAQGPRLVLVEDRFARRGDAALQGDTAARYFGDEVYYVLDSDANRAEIDRALKIGTSWPSGVILCAEAPAVAHAHKFGTHLTPDFFNAMAAGTRWFAVTAFDGETFLLWRPPDLLAG